LKIELKDYFATEGEKYRKRHELLLLRNKSGIFTFFNHMPSTRQTPMKQN
jgi:hypothetical protein